MKADLSETSTATLISNLKADPDDDISLSELNYRLKNDELSDAELINLLDVLLAIDGVS